MSYVQAGDICYILALLLMLWVFRHRHVAEDYPEIVDAIKKDLHR